MREYKQNTQIAMILKHLETNGSITSMEAFSMFGATRLSAIIFVLKKRGHIIDTEICETQHSMTGNLVRYAKYIYRGVE